MPGDCLRNLAKSVPIIANTESALLWGPENRAMEQVKQSPIKPKIKSPSLYTRSVKLPAQFSIIS
jgi:hypothetical protein